MQIRDVRRWHWMLIGLILGAGLAQVRSGGAANLRSCERIISGYAEFESALVSQQQGVRRFTNLVVYPARLSDGSGRSRSVHIVAGDYSDGKLEMIDGDLCAKWRYGCFIAESPFRHRGKDGTASSHPTVMGYLGGLASQGVSYTYAWWAGPKWCFALWMAGSFALIGIVLPSIINLFAFGSIFRPKVAKGTDLSKVKATRNADERKPQVTDADLKQVENLSEKAEEELLTEVLPSIAGTPCPSPPTPIRQLTARELEVEAEEKARLEKEFGKDEDDFYPTERHTHSHQPH
jgi:hypothetical protein